METNFYQIREFSILVSALAEENKSKTEYSNSINNYINQAISVIY